MDLPGGPCWEWPGKRTVQGYGQVQRNHRKTYAHRIAFEAFNGPLADGEIVRHLCDNPSCVNPWHLVSGDQADNMRDMMERGRGRRQFVRKMTCKRGHPLTGDNVGFKIRRDRGGRTERYCKQCVKARNSKHGG